MCVCVLLYCFLGIAVFVGYVCVIVVGDVVGYIDVDVIVMYACCSCVDTGCWWW